MTLSAESSVKSLHDVIKNILIIILLAFSVMTLIQLPAGAEVSNQDNPDAAILRQRTTGVVVSADCSSVDQYAINAPDSVETSIASLSNYLTSPWDNDLYKVRAIYRWITEHISYDEKYLQTGKYTALEPDDVLRARTTVCSGYAKLFVALAKQSGIEAEYVVGKIRRTIGYTTPYVENMDHAWNAVNIDGKWYLLDCCWAAGSVSEKKFTRSLQDYWFLTCPDDMIRTHYPHNSQWQILDSPVSFENFKLLPDSDRSKYKTYWKSTCGLTKDEKQNQTDDSSISIKISVSYDTSINGKSYHEQVVLDTCQYTGLIIDARNLGLKRAAFPRILSSDGRVIYGQWASIDNSKMQYMILNGIVAYYESPEGAKKSDRAGINPLIVQAVGVSGPGEWDIVISQESADLIEKAAGMGNLMNDFKVVVVKDKAI
jgi:hypothetical protein